jgi:hypothetical protein
MKGGEVYGTFSFWVQMLIELLEGTKYNINVDLILDCQVKDAATIASIFRD